MDVYINFNTKIYHTNQSNNHTLILDLVISANVGGNEEQKGNYVMAVVEDLEAAFEAAEKREVELDINLL